MAKLQYYQYDFADVYGQAWRVSPNPAYAQIELEDCYDTTVFGSETREERVRRKMKNLPACRIMHQRIIAGDYVESNVYPVFLNRSDIPRTPKGEASREVQKKLNLKNRQKRIVRLMNGNFHSGDLIVTLTYRDGDLPNLDRARRDIRNYLQAISRYRKKQGMTALQYIYVIEFVPEGAESRKVRIHHHLIMSKMDRDVAESKWTKGRCECKYAEPDDDFGLEGFARYITKMESGGKHLVQCSRNLKKPIIKESVTKLTRRKMQELVMAGDEIGKKMEQIFYGKCRYLDSKIYHSDFVGGFYIYSRLRKKEGADPVKKQQPINVATMPPVKIYLDMQMQGKHAEYSITLEYGKHVAMHHGCIKNTTRDRAILWITYKALTYLNKKCCLEIHATSDYLDGGFNLCRFQNNKNNRYQGTINADLIDKVLTKAAGHSISVVSEQTNKYSQEMERQRAQAERKEKVINDGR